MQPSQSILAVGDEITVRLPPPTFRGPGQAKGKPLQQARGIITESEKYRGAYILQYQCIGIKLPLSVAVFPEFLYLPAAVTKPHLYYTQAWLDWRTHTWPVAVGRPLPASQLIPGDPRSHAREKIDHILDDLFPSMHGDLELTPGNELERQQHDRWWHREI